MSTFGFPKTTTVASTLSTNPTSTVGVGLSSFTSLTSTGISPAGGINFGSFGTPSTRVTTFSTPAATSVQTGYTLPNTTKPGFNLLGTSFGQQPAATTGTAAQIGWYAQSTEPTQTGTPTTTATTTTAAEAATTTTGFITGIPSTSTSTGFTLGTPATTSATGFSLEGAAATTTTATSGFSFGVPTSSTSTGFSLDKTATSSFTTAATTTTLASLAAPATTAAVTSSLPVSSSPTVKTTTSQVKFSQLEENINKWTIELEEQEKVFMNQVAHINEWDRLLLSNGDKIISLNNNVEKVKLEQQQLDHELDFIVAQQRELEECLLPLEKEFADITVSDPERDAMYRLAENLNTQLRHMSEDLKEVIEDINEKNKNQDTTDPIVQIGRILNAHMNSLQWVDQNTTLIKQQLDQVTKLTEIHRRENDSAQNF